jgi:long-chain acyl-CoA synthetase
LGKKRASGSAADEEGTTMDYEPIRNLPTMFFDQAERYADRLFLWAKRDREWQSQSWSEVAARVSELSRTLRALGIEPGDRVALVSENRPAWLIADVAIMAAGAITVPAYTTNSEDDHHYLLNDSGAKGLIISTTALAKRALPAAMRNPSTEFAIMKPWRRAANWPTTYVSLQRNRSVPTPAVSFIRLAPAVGRRV